MQPSSVICALIQFPGMNQVGHLYKVLLLFFPKTKKSHRFANWAANMTFHTQIPKTYISPLKQILQNTSGFCFVSLLIIIFAIILTSSYTKRQKYVHRLKQETRNKNKTLS